MSQDMNLFMRVNWDARSAQAGARSLASTVNHSFTSIRGSVAGTVRVLQSLNRELNGFSAMSRGAAALGGGYALKEMIRQNKNFHRDLLEMKQTGELSRKTAEEVKRDIIESARSLSATPTELLGAMRQFTTAGFTGEKFGLAQRAYKESARAALAMFSSPEDIAKMDVDLMQKSGIRPEDLKSVHNMQLYHGRAGRFEAKDFSQNAPMILNGDKVNSGVWNVVGIG